MKGLVWKLPLLRRLSHLQRGLGLGLGVIFLGSVLFASFEEPLLSGLSNQILSDMAQIGATLLVAYAVETSWLVKQSHGRGSDSERWIGFVAGLGAAGALGIAFAVALLGHAEGPFNSIEQWAAAWAVFSLGLLAGLVGVLPYVLYEWRHALNTEYPDE